MQVEEYDFAVFGSEIDAAFFATIMATRYKARILLVRDHVNDYALQSHFHYSAGAVSELATLEALEWGLERWHEIFSSKDARACFEKQKIELHVAWPEHRALLNYIEHAMVAANKPCERKANLAGQEYLQLRNVIAPKRRPCLEYIHQKYSDKNLHIVDRSDFSEIKRLKSGQLNLKSERGKAIAKQTILFDHDLIATEENENLHQQLHMTGLNIYEFSKVPHRLSNSQIFADCAGIAASGFSGDPVLVAPLSQENCLKLAASAFSNTHPASIVSKAQKQFVLTRDGAPLLAREAKRKTWTFCADLSVAPFLAASAADFIAASGNETKFAPYWQERGINNRQCSDVGAIGAQIARGAA